MVSHDFHFDALLAISPIDGRYRYHTQKLSEWYSAYAFLKYMVKLEVEYLIAISELPQQICRPLTAAEKEWLRVMVTNFSLQDAQEINNRERFGFQGAPPLHHDLKAVEYFMKDRLERSSLCDVKEWVHFG